MKSQPTPLMQVLHVALPTLFLAMSAAFITIPYQLGEWPGQATANLRHAVPGIHLS